MTVFIAGAATGVVLTVMAFTTLLAVMDIREEARRQRLLADRARRP
jgi:hypothetical protein